jgi:hypothetical protein
MSCEDLKCPATLYAPSSTDVKIPQAILDRCVIIEFERPDDKIKEEPSSVFNVNVRDEEYAMEMSEQTDDEKQKKSVVEELP